VLEWAAENVPATAVPTLSIGLPDRFIAHAPRAALLEGMGLDADAITERIRARLDSRNGAPARTADL